MLLRAWRTTVGKGLLMSGSRASGSRGIRPCGRSSNLTAALVFLPLSRTRQGCGRGAGACRRAAQGERACNNGRAWDVEVKNRRGATAARWRHGRGIRAVLPGGKGLDGSLERDGCTSTRNVTFRVGGEVERDGARRARWSRVKGGGTTQRRGMAWNAALQATCRVAQRLKRPAGIALHCMARPISRRLTPHQPLPASFVAHQPALPFFSLGGQPPVGEKGGKGEKGAEAQEARSRHYWGDGGADYIHYMYYSIYYFTLWYPVPESP
jgi:hypothetical protein